MLYSALVQNDREGTGGLSRWDIVDDVLGTPDRDLPADQMINMVIPNQFQLQWYVPCFKYLRALGCWRLTERSRTGSAFPRGLGGESQRSIRHWPAASSRRTRGLTTSREARSRLAVQQPMAASDSHDRLTGLRDLLDADRSLRQYSWWGTQYGKVAVVYDWMRFARNC
jgi:hypothetical protein